MPSALLAAEENGLSSVFVWSLLLVALVIGGFWLVTLLKRRLQAGDNAPASPGFSLADLRALHRSGKLSDEEFERARTKMAASLKRDLNSKPPRPPRDQGGPTGQKSM